MHNKIGLSLTGGGARGAYQAGVVAGLAEILEPLAISSHPIDAISGVSAGAINGAYLAASEHTFVKSAQKLCDLWQNLSPEQVYRSDFVSVSRIGLRWLRDLTLGGALAHNGAGELLDNTPLTQLITDHIQFSQIQENISLGRLHGLACTAYDYRLNEAVSFFEASDEVGEWSRRRRKGVRQKLTTQHVLASCAIPLLFPAVPLDGSYFGDGSLRNSAPISPIIHLGASKVICVGVRSVQSQNKQRIQGKPSVAQILGTLLSGLFFDTTEIDIERLTEVNRAVVSCAETHSPTPFRKIEFVQIKPSRDLSVLANDLSAKKLPPLVDYLLRGLGERSDLSELASYLLFDSSYTSQLIDLGYQDILAKKQEIIQLIES
jgi:NTE family protein